MSSRLKAALLAAGILLVVGVAVWGQAPPGTTTSSVNPAPGALWTYLGPTLGADWTVPPTIANVAQPAHFFNAGPTSGGSAVPTFRPIGAGDIPSGITIDSLVLTGTPVFPSGITLAGLIMTGNPTAPTPPPGDNDTSVATTAFVNTQIAAITSIAVASNAQLTALATSATPYVLRRGFYAVGDGGLAYYNASNAACSLNSGNGDNGAQVKSADGKCWVADFAFAKPNVKQWGAMGDGAADDSTIINAALASADTLDLGEMNFPKAVYGICAAHINYAPTRAMTVRAVKGAEIRLLPGCASPPNEVWFTNVLIPVNADIYRGQNVIDGLTLDGYCKTHFVLNHNNGQGLTYRNMLIRNAAPHTISPYSVGAYFANGNERRMGSSNVIANENSIGHTCYTDLNSLPAAGLSDDGANDDFSGLIVVNAQTGIRNGGGDNYFGPGTHVWGGLDTNPTTGVNSYNANLRINIGIQLIYNGHAIGVEIDDPVDKGVEIGGNGGAMSAISILCRYTATPTAGQNCVEHDPTLPFADWAFIAGVMAPGHTYIPPNYFSGIDTIMHRQYDGIQLRNATKGVASLTGQTADGDNGSLVLAKDNVEGVRWQADGTAILKNLPTSCTGRPSGTVWLNSRVMQVCP